jgi:hypothetical protein
LCLLKIIFIILFFLPTEVITSLLNKHKWQARRDSNPHHPNLESGALAVRATGL